jgi:hypothetical protein
LKQKLENDRMMRLYREQVLGEKKLEGFVPLTNLMSGTPAPAIKQEAKQEEEVGAMGD